MTNRDRAVVSGLSYEVGTAYAITELIASEGADPQLVAQLQARGLRQYRQESRPMDEVLWEVASRALEGSGCGVADIDTVLLVNSPLNEEVLVKTLNIAGFERAWLLGLSFQDCGGTEAALRLATDLVAGDGRSERVLVLLYGKVLPGEGRIGWHGETVFSDAAAACVVSRASTDGFEVLASEVLTSPKLLWLRDVGAHKQYLEQCLASLATVTRNAMRRAGIVLEDVECAFATNGSRSYHNIIASAVGLPVTRVYAADLPLFGHLFSCDGLVGLTNYMSANECSSGACYLLVSWSPYVVAASVLRKN